MKIYWKAYCHECGRKAHFLWNGKCWRHSIETRVGMFNIFWLITYLPISILAIPFLTKIHPIIGDIWYLYVIVWYGILAAIIFLLLDMSFNITLLYKRKQEGDGK